MALVTGLSLFDSAAPAYGLSSDREVLEEVLADSGLSEEEQLEVWVGLHELKMMQAEEEYSVALLSILVRVGAALGSVVTFEEVTDHHITDHISDSYNIHKLEKEVEKAIEARENPTLTEKEREELIRHHIHYAHQKNNKLRVRDRRPKKEIDDLNIDKLKKRSGLF